MPLLSLAVSLAMACGGEGQPQRPDLAPEPAQCTPGGSECAAEEVCVEGLWICARRCLTDQECAASEVCREGACQSRGYWQDVATPDAGALCQGEPPDDRRTHCAWTIDGKYHWVECAEDSHCASGGGAMRCHQVLMRCVPSRLVTERVCAPCENEMDPPPCPDGYSCQEQDHPSGWGSYCLPDGVVASPSAVSCSDQGFAYDAMGPRCTVPVHCTALTAALAGLSCENDRDCAPPGWPETFPQEATCVSGTCRIPCDAMAAPACPAGMACDTSMGTGEPSYCAPSGA